MATNEQKQVIQDGYKQQHNISWRSSQLGNTAYWTW